jgi:hypothetical protein
VRGVERGGNWLCASDCRFHDEQVLRLPDFQHKLPSQVHHGRQNAFRTNPLACPAISIRPFKQFQFMDVARKRRLTDIKAFALEAVLKGILAFDGTFIEQVENRFVTGRFRHE